MSKIKIKSEYPFEITVLPEDDGGGYLIAFPDLPGCMSDGETIEQAIQNGQDAVSCWLEVAEERGQDIPKPGGSHSGQFVQRLPKSLHTRLAALAKAENTSLNQLSATFIAEGIGRLIVSQSATIFKKITLKAGEHMPFSTSATTVKAKMKKTKGKMKFTVKKQGSKKTPTKTKSAG